MSQDVSTRALIREMDPAQLQRLFNNLVEDDDLLFSEKGLNLTYQCRKGYWEMTGKDLTYIAEGLLE